MFICLTELKVEICSRRNKHHLVKKLFTILLYKYNHYT